VQGITVFIDDGNIMSEGKTFCKIKTDFSSASNDDVHQNILDGL
jgi:hypothetical protein